MFAGLGSVTLSVAKIFWIISDLVEKENGFISEKVYFQEVLQTEAGP
jgi:hypothetical protein